MVDGGASSQVDRSFQEFELEDSPVQERNLPERTVMSKDRRSIRFNESITSKGRR